MNQKIYLDNNATTSQVFLKDNNYDIIIYRR